MTKKFNLDMRDYNNGEYSYLSSFKGLDFSKPLIEDILSEIITKNFRKQYDNAIAYRKYNILDFDTYEKWFNLEGYIQFVEAVGEAIKISQFINSIFDTKCIKNINSQVKTAIVNFLIDFYKNKTWNYDCNYDGVLIERVINLEKFGIYVTQIFRKGQFKISRKNLRDKQHWEIVKFICESVGSDWKEFRINNTGIYLSWVSRTIFRY